MFSVRLPPLHQARGGPLAPGPGSTRQELERTRGGRSLLFCTHPPFHPTGFSTVRACLFTKPPLSAQSADIVLPQRHRHTQAHAHAHSLASYSTSAAATVPRPTAPGRSAPNTSSSGGLASTDVFTVTARRPCRQAHPRPTDAGARVPGNSRAPRGRTAAAAFVGCRRVGPGAEHLGCGWPSCAQACEYGFPRWAHVAALPRLPRLQQLLLGRPRRGAQTQACPPCPSHGNPAPAPTQTLALVPRSPAHSWLGCCVPRCPQTLPAAAGRRPAR